MPHGVIGVVTFEAETDTEPTVVSAPRIQALPDPMPPKPPA